MGLLSEDDRKKILGSEWKPLPANERGNSKAIVMALVIALALAGIVGYDIFAGAFTHATTTTQGSTRTGGFR